MFKKIIGITILVGLVAVLIFGAINRTQAKGTWGEANFRGNQSGYGQRYANGSNPPVQSNDGVITGQGNRWFQSNENTTLDQDNPGSQPGTGFGRGQGNQLNQSGAGYSRGAGAGDPTLGNPLAEVDEWINVEGEVTAVDSTLVTVALADGQVVEIYGRPWTYAQENGFSVQVGDRLLLTGFYEDNLLEVGAIQNLTTGASIQVREENGRPLWAGRGRRG